MRDIKTKKPIPYDLIEKQLEICPYFSTNYLMFMLHKGLNLKMVKEDLETRCKKAILRIADNVQDINTKLCHIVKYGIKTRTSYNMTDFYEYRDRNYKK